MEFDVKLNHFLSNLDKVESDHTNILLKAQLSINVCQSFLIELKADITKSSFGSLENEIHFFKFVKQVPLVQLIYFTEIKSFEIYFPMIKGKAQQKYIQQKLSFLNQYFLRHIDFGQYLELGSTYLDKFYYTRQINDYETDYFAKGYLHDPEFNTPRDFLLAEFTARKSFVCYVSSRLSQKKEFDDQKTYSKADRHLKWTASKSALTELIYALHYNRTINNGNAEIKDLAKAMEHLFNFELGDYYKTFSEIKSRKKSRTKFLDYLSAGLQTEINSSEE